MERMTYVQAIVNALEVVERESDTYTRLEELKASLEKKSTSRKKVDNSIYFDKVTEVLTAHEELSPTALVPLIGVSNTQKVTAILGSMPNVEKVTKGKKVFYKLK